MWNTGVLWQGLWSCDTKGIHTFTIWLIHLWFWWWIWFTVMSFSHRWQVSMMLLLKMLIWLGDFCWQTEKPLERFENRQFYKVTTTDDPVIRCAPAEPIQSHLFFTRFSPGIYDISHLCINWSLTVEVTYLSMVSICLWNFYYNCFSLWCLAFVI